MNASTMGTVLPSSDGVRASTTTLVLCTFVCTGSVSTAKTHNWALVHTQQHLRPLQGNEDARAAY